MEVLYNQAKALDAIKHELLLSTQPSIERLERQISELSIRQMEQKDKNKSIIQRSKALEEQQAANIKAICEETERQLRANKFLVPTNTVLNLKTDANSTNCESQDMIITRHAKPKHVRIPALICSQ